MRKRLLKVKAYKTNTIHNNKKISLEDVISNSYKLANDNIIKNLALTKMSTYCRSVQNYTLLLLY